MLNPRYVGVNQWQQYSEEVVLYSLVSNWAASLHAYGMIYVPYGKETRRPSKLGIDDRIVIWLHTNQVGHHRIGNGIKRLNLIDAQYL